MVLVMKVNIITTIKVTLAQAFHSFSSSIVDVLLENNDNLGQQKTILKDAIDVFTSDLDDEDNRQLVRQMCRDGYTAMMFGSLMVAIEGTQTKGHLVRVELIYRVDGVNVKSFFINNEDLQY